MSDQTSETHRRRWCVEFARYYSLSPAELYVLLMLADISGWELLTEEWRQNTLGLWFSAADSGKDQADLSRLQREVVNDYRMECDRAEGREG